MVNGEDFDDIVTKDLGELAFVSDDREGITEITCAVEATDGTHSASTRVTIKLEKTFAG